MKNAYGNAGVDVNAGYELVKKIKDHVKKTKRPEVLGDLGGFGGAFDLSHFSYQEPVLVSGTDGVGTKILLAQQMNTHDTIGIDAVAMCVNDVVAQGALPLFFLDYLACGKNEPQKLAEVVKGVADGCLESGCALIGGETAEMPGLYEKEEYDLAGFTVGIAEKSHLIQKENVKKGDLLIGLPSSGLHSNGFSLVRKIFFEKRDFSLKEELPELTKPLGEELLTPTKIYVKTLKPLLEKNLLHGISHITGGGFIENLPRMFGEDLAAKVDVSSYPLPAIFQALEKYGELNRLEMYEIFNMGLGMVLAIAPENLKEVSQILKDHNEPFYIVGEMTSRKKDAVILEGLS